MIVLDWIIMIIYYQFSHTWLKVEKRQTPVPISYDFGRSILLSLGSAVGTSLWEDSFLAVS